MEPCVGEVGCPTGTLVLYTVKGKQSPKSIYVSY